MRVSTADQKLDLQHAGLEQLMKPARNHEFDVVLVWKFDHLARSVAHLVRALEDFNHLDIRFISVQDQIDTDSPMGKAMFTIIGAMAELESDLISERVKAGMAAAKARGKHVGRPGVDGDLQEEIRKKALDKKLSANAIARMYMERGGDQSQRACARGQGLENAVIQPDNVRTYGLFWPFRLRLCGRAAK